MPKPDLFLTFCKRSREPSQYRLMHESLAGTPIGYSFGPFFLDTQRLALSRDGVPVDVSPRSLELVTFLLQSEGRVVSKDEIIEVVWRGASVSDGNIAQHIHMAREALGDTRRPHLYLKTVPGGGGYRFSGVATPAFGASDRQAARELRQFTAAQILSNAAYFAKIGTPPALESSIDFSTRALSLAPSAEGYAQIAMSHFLQGAFSFRGSQEALALAELHAKEARRLNPRSVRANSAMALVHLFLWHDPARSLDVLGSEGASRGDLEEFWIIRMLAPLASGDVESTRAACNEALTILPASSIVNLYVGFALFHAGCIGRADDHLRRILAVKPSSGFAIATLGFVSLADGDFARARDLFEKLILPSGRLLSASGKLKQWAIAGLSYIEGRLGNLETSRALSRDLETMQYVSPTLLALSAVSRNEYDVALLRLAQANKSRDFQFPFAHCNPLFEPIKSAPGFLALLSRVAA